MVRLFNFKRFNCFKEDINECGIMNIFVDPLLFLQFLRELCNGVFNNFFLSCSFYGETVSTILIMAAFYWCIDKKLGEFLLISFCGTSIVASFLKNLVCMYRPWILDSRIHSVEAALPAAGGYSFPSGHTMNATSLFGGIILRTKYSKTLKVILAVCIMLIAFSRLYLGVHSVLDVGFGLLFAVIVLIIFNKLFDKLDENPNLDIIISVVGLIIMILLTVFCLTKAYPMDYDAAGKLLVDPVIINLSNFYVAGPVVGLLISWPIERRFIKFSHEGTTDEKILRFLGGLIGIGLIATVIMPLIGSKTYIHNFAGTFLLGLFVMLIYPAIIKFFQNRKKSEV